MFKVFFTQAQKSLHRHTCDACDKVQVCCHCYALTETQQFAFFKLHQ